MKNYPAMIYDVIKSLFESQESDGLINVEVSNVVDVAFDTESIMQVDVINTSLEVNIKDQESTTGRAVRIIDYPEEYAAYGYAWGSNVVINIPANTSLFYTLDLSQVPAGRDVYRLGAHITANGAEVRFILYEDTNYSGGTEIVFTNPNRIPAEQKSKNFKVFNGSTGTIKGTQLAEHVAFGATAPGQTKTSGQADLSVPFTFNNAKKYLFEYKNVSGTAATLEIDILYVEADF